MRSGSDVIATLITGAATWTDYVALLGRVSQPVTTPKNMTPGAVAWRAGADLAVATSESNGPSVVGDPCDRPRSPGFAAIAATGFIVGMVASQLLSPLLWDHYAMLLLLPVALLLERRQWWAILIPLATWLPSDVVYPAVFAAGLLGPILTRPPADEAQSMTPQQPVLFSP